MKSASALFDMQMIEWLATVFLRFWIVLGIFAAKRSDVEAVRDLVEDVRLGLQT